MQKRVFLSIFASLVILVALVSAQEYVLDIKIGKQIYSLEENVTYRILLFNGNTPISDKVSITISDIAEKNKFDLIVDPGKDLEFFINKSFSSGYWKIEANYQNKNVKRFFTVGENEEADFSIEGDMLIIRNIGNVPYTKEIKILIGSKTITQRQNIAIGDYREIRLIAPQGNYHVEVTDGIKTISQGDIYLAGTGKVIGALDEEMVKKQPVFGGVRDSEEEDLIISSGSKPYFGVILVGAIFGIFILLCIERFVRRRRGDMGFSMLQHQLK